MTEKKNNRNSCPGEAINPENHQGVHAKEYCYVFRLSLEDNRILNRHRDSIARAATGFAEIYYEYLFDNPEIASILYVYERSGGDIGQWVRAQLGYLFNVFAPETGSEQKNDLTAAGERHHEQGFKPVWIISTYHLFIDHLEGLLPGLNLASDESVKLGSVLIKLLLRNLGLVMEGYWHAAGRHAVNELLRLEKGRDGAEGLLGCLPFMCWCVDIKKNDVVFANPPMETLYGQGLEAPLPCLSDTCEEDQPKLLASWQNAISGAASQAEIRMSLAGGESRWYRIALYPDCNRLGRTTMVHCILEDFNRLVTERGQGGQPFEHFDPVSEISSDEPLRHSAQISTALENNEFELHYQPQVDLQTSRIIGAEALLRWMHPLEGTVMPQRVIPLAEQLGMITPLDNWVLLTALTQCRQWSFEGTPVPVSVNVSACSFQDPGLLGKVLWAISEAGVDGDCLEIEITEAALMQDIGRATEILTQLCDRGVTVAIDDFGTGYFSLSRLKRLPIHVLKIDQSFITGLVSGQQDVAIVRSMIDMGHNLGYKVIAEGVENASSWDLLNSLGCDAAQGFHISKPLPDSRFSSLLCASCPPGQGTINPV